MNTIFFFLMYMYNFFFFNVQYNFFFFFSNWLPWGGGLPQPKGLLGLPQGRPWSHGKKCLGSGSRQASKRCHTQWIVISMTFHSSLLQRNQEKLRVMDHGNVGHMECQNQTHIRSQLGTSVKSYSVCLVSTTGLPASYITEQSSFQYRGCTSTKHGVNPNRAHKKLD